MVYYRNNKSDPPLFCMKICKPRLSQLRLARKLFQEGRGLSSDCGGWGDLASFCISLIISPPQGDGRLAAFHAASLVLILAQRNDAACP